MKALLVAAGLAALVGLSAPSTAEAAGAAGSVATVGSGVVTPEASAVEQVHYRRGWRGPRVYFSFGYVPRVYGYSYYRPYYARPRYAYRHYYGPGYYAGPRYYYRRHW